jgi:prepilin signal peptidase PulO-like enzyme (type II secretory pathway)
MATVILFVLGAIVGSFLNVVGLRFNSGLSLGGRSFCPHCGKTLKWYELVPVLSFIYLRGRCAKCLAKISFQYPAVEILTGLIFATIFNVQFSILQNLMLLVIFSIYIVIAIYDLRHKIIPNSLVYSAIVLSLGFGIFRFVWDFGFGIWDLAAGPILFAFFAAIWLLSRGRAIGFGDAKLSLSIGLLLGAAISFSAIILAFWIGAIFGLGYIVFSRISPLLKGSKNITMKSEIPFAPFMILGAWLSLIWNLNLLYVTYF